MQRIKTSYYPGIDLLKSIGLLLMVCGHYSLMNSVTTTIIYSFHMPLFFIISGFISRERSFKETITKGFKSIMIPYFVFNAVLLLFTILLEYRSAHLSFHSLWSHVTAIMIGIGYKTDIYNPVCTTMWFFYVMFLVKIFSALVGNNSRMRIAISFLAIAIVGILKKNDVNTDFPIDSFLMAFPLYVWGGILKQVVEHLKFDNSKRYYLSCLVLPIMFYLSYYNGRADMDVFEYGHSLFLFYFISISICSVLIISVLFIGVGNLVRICHNISKGAPIIVSFNLWLILALKKILAFIFPCIVWNNLIGLVIAISVIIICYPVTCFCNKYCSFALGYRK